MKNPFEMFETSNNYEVNGVWQDFGTFKVLLARSGGHNTRYFKTLNKEIKKCGKATFGSLSEEEGKAIIVKTFISSIIKDHQVKVDGKWKQGIFIKKDEEVVVVPYTPKNMEICLTQLPEYFSKIKEYSDDFATFQDEVEKEQIKKSETILDGALDMEKKKKS